MSDLYALDLLTNEWTKLSPSGAQPHARCAHGAAAAPLGRHLLVFGGGSLLPSGVARALVTEGEVHFTRTKLPAEEACRWVFDPRISFLAVFKDIVQEAVSGSLPSQVLDDTICYDTVDNKWVPVAQGSGPPLPARNAHTLVPIAKHENKWLLHGGWVPFVSTFNDTYVVELKV
eukprot:1140417-Pelagomonas_calceolata.AAC.4